MKRGPKPTLDESKDEEIIKMIGDGLFHKEIASQLGVTHEVLRNRVSKLKRMYGAKSLWHLIKLFTQDVELNKRTEQ